MKTFVYLALIGSISANSVRDGCPDTAADNAKIQADNDKEALLEAQKTETSEATEFRKLKNKAQMVLAKATIRDKLVKMGDDDEKKTMAATKLEEATTALSSLIAENSTLNDILVAIDEKQTSYEESNNLYIGAVSSCVPTYFENLNAQKVENRKELTVDRDTQEQFLNSAKELNVNPYILPYVSEFGVAMTEDETTKFDEANEALVTKKNEMFRDIRQAAKFQSMSEDAQELFDSKVFVSEYNIFEQNVTQLQKQVGEAFEDGPLRTTLLAYVQKMALDEFMFKTMTMVKGGMFTDELDQDQISYFSQDFRRLNRGFLSRQDAMIQKMKELATDDEFSTLSEEKQTAWIKSMIEKMNDKEKRDMVFSRVLKESLIGESISSDSLTRAEVEMKIKVGFYSMNTEDKSTYESWLMTKKDEIIKMLQAVDDKVEQLKTTAKFADKTKEDQQKFMKTFDIAYKEILAEFQQDMQKDNETRRLANYWKINESARSDVDNQVLTLKGKRTMMRMPILQGEVGSSCKPLPLMKEDGQWERSTDDKMKMGMMEMMNEKMGKMSESVGGKKMNDMMDMMDMDKEGMMNKMGGTAGIMDMMQQKMSGEMVENISGLADKMSAMWSQQMEENPDADMTELMKEMEKNMKGLEQKGKEQMWKQTMSSEKGSGDLLDLIGGPRGLMTLFGMTGGKTQDGKSMKDAFDAKVEKKNAETKQDAKKIVAEGTTSMRDYNDGCGEVETLCCGQTLEFGVWGDDYKCNLRDAETLGEVRFQCVEGAKYVAAGAMSLIVAAFMMV